METTDENYSIPLRRESFLIKKLGLLLINLTYLSIITAELPKPVPEVTEIVYIPAAK